MEYSNEDAYWKNDASIPKALRASVSRKFDAEEYYDALQVIKTFVSRFLAKREHTLAVTVCYHYAKAFAEKNNQLLGLDLINSIITIFQEEMSLKAKPLEIQMIVELFSLCATSSCPAKDRYQVISRAIRWSQSPSLPNGAIELHKVAAVAAMDQDDFGNCQGHLVFCNEPQLLANMMNRWTAQGYPSERPYFWLRAVCILLSLEELDVAEAFLVKHSGIDFNQIVPGPLQLAFMLIYICKHKSQPAFKTIQAKYHLIIRRDPYITKLINYIERVYIGVSASNMNSGNIMSMLSSFFNPPSTSAA